MKLFEADPIFFALLLGHILAMEVLGWLIVYLLGPGWVSSTLAALILAISQVTLGLPNKQRASACGHSGHTCYMNE
jgi:hypothetical protein